MEIRRRHQLSAGFLCQTPSETALRGRNRTSQYQCTDFNRDRQLLPGSSVYREPTPEPPQKQLSARQPSGRPIEFEQQPVALFERFHTPRLLLPHRCCKHSGVINELQCSNAPMLARSACAASHSLCQSHARSAKPSRSLLLKSRAQSTEAVCSQNTASTQAVFLIADTAWFQAVFLIADTTRVQAAAKTQSARMLNFMQRPRPACLAHMKPI